MGKTGANNRKTADFYTLQAKKEGYPARSIYKLKEIDEKWGLLKPQLRLLEVGSAPGSWSLYALRKIGLKGFLCGVDLKEMSIKPQSNALFLQGDAFSEEQLQKINQYGPYDGLLCDAAPATTGNRLVDTSASYSLVEEVILLSSKVLVKGGFLVVKIFQGGDENQLVKWIQSFFKDCRKLKPKACRKDSFESYLIGLNFMNEEISSKEESNENS